MKEGSRVLGIDDAPIELERLVGVLYRGTEFIESVEIIEAEPDQGEGTQKVIELYGKFQAYIEAVLIDGISFSGFNIVNIEKVSEKIDRPVIAVTSNEPDPKSFSDALEKTGTSSQSFENLPTVSKFKLSTGRCFVQFSGCDRKEALDIVNKSTLQGNVPECIRAADIIGSALTNNGVISK